MRALCPAAGGRREKRCHRRGFLTVRPPKGLPPTKDRCPPLQSCALSSTHWAAGRLPSWPGNRVVRTGSAQHQEGYAHPAPDPRSEWARTLGSAAGWGSAWRAGPAPRPLGPGVQPGSWWEQEPGQVSDGCRQTTRAPSSADAQGASRGRGGAPHHTCKHGHPEPLWQQARHPLPHGLGGHGQLPPSKPTVHRCANPPLASALVPIPVSRVTLDLTETPSRGTLGVGINSLGVGGGRFSCCPCKRAPQVDRNLALRTGPPPGLDRTPPRGARSQGTPGLWVPVLSDPGDQP